MKDLLKKIDVKSLLIGFLAGLCILLFLGQNNYSTGRFQCTSVSQDFRAVFVLDSVTGQVWRLDPQNTLDFGTPYDRNLFEEDPLKDYWEEQKGFWKK